MYTLHFFCKWKLPLITGLFLFMSAALLAQNFSAINHAYWYQAEPPVQSKLMVWEKSPDTLQVIASVTFNESSGPEAYRTILHQQNQLDTAIAMPPPILLQPFRKTGNNYFLKADLPKRNTDNGAPIHFFLLEVQDTAQAGNSFWAMTSLAADNSFPPAPFYISSLPDSTPLFRQYANEKEDFSLHGSPPLYTMFYYDKSFEIASPPMTAGPSANSGLEVTSTSLIRADAAFQPSGEGLYFIQHDTTQLSGQSFRQTNPYFPEVGTLEDFAGPIRYISTSEEWQQIEKSNFDKKEIDRFWLKVVQSEELAKRVIRQYYQRVSKANQLFTNYKEGWKTDQGMIFILYGPPDVVTAEADREQWIYHQSSDLPEIKFTFVHVKNPFTDRHFVLLRNKNYARSHYQTVSKWRKGKNIL